MCISLNKSHIILSIKFETFLFQIKNPLTFTTLHSPRRSRNENGDTIKEMTFMDLRTYLRESLMIRERVAWELSTQPRTARIPHMVGGWMDGWWRQDRTQRLLRNGRWKKTTKRMIFITWARLNHSRWIVIFYFQNRKDSVFIYPSLLWLVESWEKILENKTKVNLMSRCYFTIGYTLTTT